MSPPVASLPPHPCCERDNRLSAAASILLSMSHEEPPQPDGDTSDEQPNSSDLANATRKGQPWSEEEHLAFLQGLRALGKGNWRAIARQYLPSRSPTQIASHAQKHFMRVAGTTKRKSRFTALEIEVGPPAKPVHASESGQSGQENRKRTEPQTTSVAQPSTSAYATAPFPAMPFPFMHPMMFGFPGPFFPPFMCPSPALATAALGAMKKQGSIPVMQPPPMFPMVAAMAAMNPFFMAQQMAAAAQAAAVANAAAAAAANAATSGDGTTACTGPTATTDTANSEEVPRRQTHSMVAGSPTICKPAAQHARPAAAALAAVGSGAAQCGVSGSLPLTGTASGAFGGGLDGCARNGPRPGAAGSGSVEHAALLAMGPRPGAVGRPEEGVSSFHASTHSAFRPPQEVKTESQGAAEKGASADRAGAPSAW